MRKPVSAARRALQAILVASLAWGTDAFAETAPASTAAAVPAVAAPQPVGKPRIAVTEFKAIGVEPAVAQAVTEKFCSALLRMDKFTVVERGELARILKEQEFGQSGLVDPAQAATMGKLLGVSTIAVGSVTKLGRGMTLSVRFVDVATAATTRSETQRVPDVQHLTWATNHLAALFSGVPFPMKGAPVATPAPAH